MLKIDKLKELEEIYNQCSENNWDGYNAIKISKRDFDIVKNIIFNWNENLTLPNLGCTPQGDFTFEWYKDINNFISITIYINIKEEIIFYYAGYINGSLIHGNCEYNKDYLPEIILNYIGDLK